LYLAQLEDEPKLALQHYQAAVDTSLTLLKGKEAQLSNSSPEPASESEIRGNIIRALCAMVEIWMTDLWCVCSDNFTSYLLKLCSFENEAEETCDSLIKTALQIDGNNPEALQALASYRLSQQKPDDAKIALEQSWAAWKDLEPGRSRIVCSAPKPIKILPR
jgi:hypothetical protein